jgi:hypothetical protein
MIFNYMLKLKSGCFEALFIIFQLFLLESCQSLFMALAHLFLALLHFLLALMHIVMTSTHLLYSYQQLLIPLNAVPYLQLLRILLHISLSLLFQRQLLFDMFLK